MSEVPDELRECIEMVEYGESVVSPIIAAEGVCATISFGNDVGRMFADGLGGIFPVAGCGRRRPDYKVDAICIMGVEQERQLPGWEVEMYLQTVAEWSSGSHVWTAMQTQMLGFGCTSKNDSF